MGDGVTQSSAMLGIEAAGASSGAAAVVRNSGITLQSPQSMDITLASIKLRIYMWNFPSTHAFQWKNQHPGPLH